MNSTVDTALRFPVEVVGEMEAYLVTQTALGGLRRDHKNYSATTEIVDYACGNWKEDAMVRAISTRSLLAFLTGVLIGCGGGRSSQGLAADGRVYFEHAVPQVTRPIKVVWFDEETQTTVETLVEQFKKEDVTQRSVKGGTEVTIRLSVEQAGYRLHGKAITVTVDGSITVRLTKIGWDNPEDIEWTPIAEG